jgi:NAD(P)-dependent dehydrogenase (short-subunit alcohol dehydrogenase family)
VQIAGNVALVTGAGSGLGAASAARLRAAGAHLVLADIADVDAPEGDRFVRCDVTSEPDVQAAVEQAAALGRFAISVHCAGGGIASRTLARDGTPHALDAFRRVVELNLVGTFNVLRLAAAQMAHNTPDPGGERGVCVQTASIAGYEGQIGQLPYSAAKGGVLGMTLVAARDLSPLGIRVVTIAPGTINTPAYGKAADQLEQYWAPQIPFPKRMGRSTEYAQLAQSIIENDYLNGEIIRLDGALRFPPK